MELKQFLKENNERIVSYINSKFDGLNLTSIKIVTTFPEYSDQHENVFYVVVKSKAIVGFSYNGFEYHEVSIDVSEFVKVSDIALHIRQFLVQNPSVFSVIPEATKSSSGLMSQTDKVKLDGLSNYVHPAYTKKPLDLYRISVDGKGHVAEAVPYNMTKIISENIQTAFDCDGSNPRFDGTYWHTFFTNFGGDKRVAGLRNFNNIEDIKIFDNYGSVVCDSAMNPSEEDENLLSDEVYELLITITVPTAPVASYELELENL